MGGSVDKQSFGEQARLSIFTVFVLTAIVFLFYFTFRPFEFSDNGVHYLESARRSTFADPDF